MRDFWRLSRTADHRRLLRRGGPGLLEITTRRDARLTSHWECGGEMAIDGNAETAANLGDGSLGRRP